MFARVAITIVTIVTAIAATAQSAQAQTPPERPKWEFLVSNGQLVPTGAQREEFDRGNLTALQVGASSHRPAVRLQWVQAGSST